MIEFTPETKLSEEQIHNLFSVEGAVFCDIGARIGEFSIPRAHSCKEVYAFEPSPFNFPTLEDRAKEFGDKYKCFNVAFSDKDYDCVTPFKDCTNESEQEIKYRTMEKFFADNNLDTPTFVKIDVEGMESHILKTMDFLFEKKVPIYAEIHYNSKFWGRLTILQTTHLLNRHQKEGLILIGLNNMATKFFMMFINGTQAL